MKEDRVSREDYMEDSRGRLVPKSLVPEIDRLRSELVGELLAKAALLQTAMRDFKTGAMADVGAFVDLSAEKYDVKMGGQKGNISLVSFDGRRKIQVAISEHLVFDERLQAAKKLIDECLTSWTEDSRAEIKTLVMDAFQVDQEGRLNTGRILGLRRLNIEDEKWQRAMCAIADSVQVVGSRSYLRIYLRAQPDEKWSPIALDIAAL